MAYNFEDRLNRLSPRMRTLNSRPVQYWRGGNVLFEAAATVYELKTDDLIAFGVTLDARHLDFIFSRKQMPIGLRPLEGDAIYDPKLDVYCKVSRLGGEAHYRWVSHTREAMRIHSHVATYSIPQSELDLVSLMTRSSVGAVQTLITTLPMETVFVGSVLGDVAVEADMNPLFSGSVVGELNEDTEDLEVQTLPA